MLERDRRGPGGVPAPQPRRLVPVLIGTCVLVGASGAIQGVTSGELAQRLGGGFAGVALSSNLNGVVGLLLVALVVALPAQRRAALTLWSLRRTRGFWVWGAAAGIAGTSMTFAQAAFVPVLGVGVFTICAVGGQIVFSLFADRIGLSAAGSRPITVRRALAVVAVIAAVLIGTGNRLGGDSLAWPLILLTLIAGAAIVFQQAGNGRLSLASGSPFSAALLNYLIGFVLSSFVVGITLALTGQQVAAPLDWWLYLSGPIGVCFVIVSAIAVNVIGVLSLGLSLVCGQIAGSAILQGLVLDANTTPALALAASAALTVAAVLLSAVGNRARGRVPSEEEDSAADPASPSA